MGAECGRRWPILRPLFGIDLKQRGRFCRDKEDAEKAAADRAPRRRDARRREAYDEHARYRRGDAQGSVISPGCLLQNQLVQRQIRDRLPEPQVLGLQLLKSLHLVRLQTAVLIAPAIVRHFRHPDRADRIRYRQAANTRDIGLGTGRPFRARKSIIGRSTVRTAGR